MTVDAKGHEITVSKSHNMHGGWWLATCSCGEASRTWDSVEQADYEVRRHVEEAQLLRDRAIELASRALTPMAGAYRDTKDYAEHIIDLADRLGEYMQHGLES